MFLGVLNIQGGEQSVCIYLNILFCYPERKIGVIPKCLLQDSSHSYIRHLTHLFFAPELRLQVFSLLVFLSLHFRDCSRQREEPEYEMYSRGQFGFMLGVVAYLYVFFVVFCFGLPYPPPFLAVSC